MQEFTEDDEIISEDLRSEETPAEELLDIQDGAPEYQLEPGDLQHQIGAIQAQLMQLKEEFTGKIKYDAHKDQVIDKLHQELQEYKQDIVKKHILSIVLDVVKVADDIRKWLAYFRSLDVSQRDPVKLFRYLEAIPSDLEDIFYWQGVKPYTNREGVFNPAKQRAIKKIPTDDILKDKTIAKSLRPGYEWEDKVIRQEMVAVYVYEDETESGDTRSIDE
jgi:molecular chaperone GrpE (heat shock protein)